jgi:hypothetical protein
VNKFDTSIKAQRDRLLDSMIRIGSVNTLFARDRLNIMAPAARVAELRKAGHQINTVPVEIYDRDGRPHCRVARYVLVKLATEAAA